MLSLNIPDIQNKISSGLSFYQRFTKDTFPSLITTKSLVINSLHVDSSDYIPSSKNARMSTSIAISSFTKACATAFNATGNSQWKTLCANSAKSFTDYFFVEPVPNTADIWDPHWLCVALGIVPLKGSQPVTSPTTDPFNYGNFDSQVTFTNGVGVIANSLVADVYRVLPTTSLLRYRNIFAPLKSGDELEIEYWVSNYYLEGFNYRIYTNGSKVPTSEAIGTIKLVKSFSGNCKVTWSDYSGGEVFAPSSSTLTGNELLKSEPIWNRSRKYDRTIYLDSSFLAQWLAWDTMSLLSKIDLNPYWARCRDAIEFTTKYSLRLQNNVFYYKKENALEPFRHYGSNALTTNTLPFQPSALVAARETVANKLNYLRLEASSNDINSQPNLIYENTLIQSDIDRSLQFYIEYATSQDTILEVQLFLSRGYNPSQVYTAYIVTGAGTAGKNISLNYFDFIRWDGAIWHPRINLNPVTATKTGNAFVSASFVQKSIGIVNPVVLYANFTKNTGTAEVKINGENFNTNPPSFEYASVGQLLIKVKDSAGNVWITSLPDSSGQWRTYYPSWGLFYTIGGSGQIIVATPAPGNIQECSIEVAQGSGYVFLWYVAGQQYYYPQIAPIPSTIYKASIVSKIKTAHVLWIGDFRTTYNQKDKIPYTPGAVPFAREVLKASKVGGGYSREREKWSEGNLEIANISPYHLYIWGDIEACDNQIRFIADSFTAYTNQSSSRIRGLPIPNFISNYWETDSLLRFADKVDSVVLQIMGFVIPRLFDKKTVVSNDAYRLNYFSWRGNARTKKNLDWFGNTAIAMEALSRYCYANTSDIRASSLITQYLTYLNNDYEIRNSLRPITSTPEIYDPQSNFDNPEFAARIGITALYGNLAGIDAKLTTEIIDICYRYLNSQFVSTGVMSGSFTASQPTFTHDAVTYRECFATYQSSCIEFLSLLVIHQEFINYPPLSTLGILPSIEPTKISQIKAANYPKESLVFSDGNRQILRHRISQRGRTITIEYKMISDEDLEVLVAFWQLHGTSELFQIPNDIPILSQWRFDSFGQLSDWRMQSPITIETVVATSVRGMFNANITLVQD